MGHKVTILYLNRGEDPQLDSLTCVPPNDGIRVREAEEACRILGATAAFVPQCNGRSIVDLAHYRAFTDQLADLNPDVILTQWPIDDHPDHRAITSLTYGSWNRLGRKAAFYYYEVSNGEDTQMFQPTDFVDIAGVEQIKRRACYAHASQDPDRFYALQAEVALFRGIESGFTQAEGFVRHVRSSPGPLP
jgi:LmbE family N-acetylglucosaminyl deacetylase